MKDIGKMRIYHCYDVRTFEVRTRLFAIEATSAASAQRRAATERPDCRIVVDEDKGLASITEIDSGHALGHVQATPDPPFPWSLASRHPLMIRRAWHSETMYAGVSYKGWLTCHVGDDARPTPIPPDAAAWLLSQTGGKDPRPPVPDGSARGGR